MATEEKQSTEQTETSDEHTSTSDEDASTEDTSTEDTDGDDGPEMTEKPEVTEEHHEVAREMAKAYEDDRPTATLPGSGHTVTGQAVNDWLDEDGKPKHGEVENEIERQG